MKFKINIKVLIMTLIASSSLMFTSCEDWLNVKPSDQVAAEEQFSKEEGFKAALTGVYTLMTKPEMYGREMTFGVVDYLGQYWAAPQAFSTYYGIYSYDYEKADARKFVDEIWNKTYNAIANANDLLAFIDVKKGVFESEQSYSLIKGETLALRAYLHFDMLRLFAPDTFVGGGDAAKKWLPYTDVYSSDTKLSLTNEEFIKKVIDDLVEATDLMKVDPIYTGAVSEDTYFKNRFYHMNYYAVRALLARVYLYAGQKDNAATVAQEVVDAQESKGLFKWVSVDDVTLTDMKLSDRTFSTEHIFSLNITRLGDNIKTYFTEPSLYNKLLLSTESDALFEGEGDYRAKFVESKNVVNKFDQPKAESGSVLQSKLQRIPLIRISEMYYILAECKEDNSYLNMVRVQRGIESPINPAQIPSPLFMEMRKEFIGEGQFFYYCKRVNLSKIDDTNAGQIGYTLLMPENEINLGGRPRP